MSIKKKKTMVKKFNVSSRNNNFKKEQSDGSRKAKLRPSNFEELSARDQWEIDKELGILDWDGS